MHFATNRHAELDRYMTAKEAAVAKVRDGAKEREHQLEENLRETQSHLEDAELKLRQLEWANEDLIRDKDATIEK